MTVVNEKVQTSSRPLWVQEMRQFLNAKPSGEAPLRQVAEHGMRFVPPGPAWREGTAKRKTDARYRGADDEVSGLENERVIRNGSKRIVLRALYHETKVGRMTKFERDGRKWIRLDQSEKQILT